MTPKIKAPDKGHVELFRVSDEQDFEVYLDGNHYISVRRDSPTAIILYSSQRCLLAIKAGVAEDDLRFSLSQPIWHAQDLGLDLITLSAGGGLDYKLMANWRQKHPSQFNFFALSLKEAEVELIKGGW